MFQETKNLWKAKLEGPSQEESFSAKLGKGSAFWLLRKFKNETQKVGMEGVYGNLCTHVETETH